jgi:hypothetical protein
MGRWTSDDLGRQWTGMKMFVVDAEFGREGGAEERCTFLLGTESFGDVNTRKRTRPFSCSAYLVILTTNAL